MAQRFDMQLHGDLVEHWVNGDFLKSVALLDDLGGDAVGCAAALLESGLPKYRLAGFLLLAQLEAWHSADALAPILRTSPADVAARSEAWGVLGRSGDWAYATQLLAAFYRRLQDVPSRDDEPIDAVREEIAAVSEAAAQQLAVLRELVDAAMSEGSVDTTNYSTMLVGLSRPEVLEI